MTRRTRLVLLACLGVGLVDAAATLVAMSTRSRLASNLCGGIERVTLVAGIVAAVTLLAHALREARQLRDLDRLKRAGLLTMLLAVLLVAPGCAPEIVAAGPGPGLCPDGDDACGNPPVVVTIVDASSDAGDDARHEAGDGGEDAGPPLDRTTDPTVPEPTSTPALGGAGGAGAAALGGGGGAGGGSP